MTFESYARLAFRGSIALGSRNDQAQLAALRIAKIWVGLDALLAVEQ